MALVWYSYRFMIKTTALIAFGAILWLGFGHFSMAEVSREACLNALQWNKVRFADVEKTLKTGKITTIENQKLKRKQEGKNPQGTSETYLLTFENGMQGIFKADLHDSAAAEVGAYQIDRKLLHHRLVPPTVYRTIDGLGFGSIQYFVKSDVDWMEWEVRNSFPVSRTDESNRDAFYFVFGQWDRHAGNVIVDDTGHFALIDNTSIKSRNKVRYGELPYIIKFSSLSQYQKPSPTAFPFDDFKEFVNPTPFELLDFFQGKVGLKAIQNHFKWWFKTDKNNEYKPFTLRIIFWENRVWIQTSHPVNASYGPIQFEFLSRKTLDAYRALTFESLREILDPKAFPDINIREMLERRDQLLEIAKTVPVE
jgi:hypothetical protein